MQNTLAQHIIVFHTANLSKMVFCYQNCSSDRETLLKFEAGRREFANSLRSLEQFIQTVEGQNNFW